MDLLLTGVLLVALQCLVALPAAGLLLVPLAGAFRAVRGPRLSLLSPWPGSRSLISGGYPFEVGASRVHTESPAHVLRGAALAPVPRSQPLAGNSGWSVRSNALFGDAGRLLGTVSKAHACHLAAFLGKLAEAAPDERAAVVAAELDAAFDLDACRRAFDEVRRRTRVLRWTCNVYAALVFVVLPVLLLRRDEEAAWLAVIPWILILHLVGVVALVPASQGLAETAAERFERILVAALYPPALLRSPIDVMNDRLVRYHPVAAASLVLGSRDLRRLVQITSAEYAHPVWRRHRPCPVPEEAERRAFLAELGARVEAAARTLRVDLRPDWDDPTAASYCPLCLHGYRPGFEACAACGIPTRPFGSASAAS